MGIVLLSCLLFLLVSVSSDAGGGFIGGSGGTAFDGGTVNDPLIIDGDGVMFEVRKDGNGEKALTVDTTNSSVSVSGTGQLRFPSSSTTIPPGPAVGNWAGTFATFSGGGLVSTTNLSQMNFSSGVRISIGNDVHLLREGAAQFQMGVDAAVPVPQTWKAHDAVGTDNDGADLNIQSGNNTGAANPGSVNVRTASPGTTGSTEGTPVTRMSFDGSFGYLLPVANEAATAPPVNHVRHYVREDIDQGVGIALADCALVAQLSDLTEVLIQVYVTDGGC